MNALNKVLNILELNKVSYIVKNIKNKKIINSKNFKNDNFDKILSKAFSNYNYNYKITLLLKQINSLDNIKLKELLSIIEDFLDE